MNLGEFGQLLSFLGCIGWVFLLGDTIGWHYGYLAGKKDGAVERGEKP